MRYSNLFEYQNKVRRRQTETGRSEDWTFENAGEKYIRKICHPVAKYIES